MLRYSLLGPLEVERDGEPVEIAGQKQRAVLASLALNAGQVVPTERLITELWGESPPPTAATALQNAVSQLRKALGAEPVVTKAPGYMLAVDRSQVDVHRFEAELDAAKSAGAEERRKLLKGALGLWRGPPLAEFTYESFAQGEIGRLEERRLAAVEDLLEAELELGNAAELVGEIESLVRDSPLRERLRGQLMRALYGSGRQAEALQAYQETRRVLVDELGIEPSPALQQLHASILRQESTLEPQPVAGIGGDLLGEVLRALLGGRLVAVLGPGPPSANGDVLAVRLADTFDCPEEHRGDLTRVSQYVAVTQGVGPLYDELHALFSAEPEPGPMETLLQGCPALRGPAGSSTHSW